MYVLLDPPLCFNPLQVVSLCCRNCLWCSCAFPNQETLPEHFWPNHTKCLDPSSPLSYLTGALQIKCPLPNKLPSIGEVILQTKYHIYPIYHIYQIPPFKWKKRNFCSPTPSDSPRQQLNDLKFEYPTVPQPGVIDNHGRRVCLSTEMPDVS